MLYRVIGLMSGSSLDGLDLVYVQLEAKSGQWTYELLHSACYSYDEEWTAKLSDATNLSAWNYLSLHSAYGHYLGQQVNRFINENHLQYQVQLISSHGHTVFHDPVLKMTAQLGDGAAIAAETGINVISDLRAMDIALGGQGAPIVPIGEKGLLGEFPFFLNLGGIANLSAHLPAAEGEAKTIAETDRFVAFDICPANRVLNLLTAEKGLTFDDGGRLASSGIINNELFGKLNEFGYYALPHPKALANDFGVREIYPLLQSFPDRLENKLRTYVEHICFQIGRSIAHLLPGFPHHQTGMKMLVTGGGAHNDFLMDRLKFNLSAHGVEPVKPDPLLIDFKEALVMAYIGVLRWREERNVLSSVTGASRDSIGGAVWIGQEV